MNDSTRRSACPRGSSRGHRVRHSHAVKTSRFGGRDPVGRVLERDRVSRFDAQCSEGREVDVGRRLHPAVVPGADDLEAIANAEPAELLVEPVARRTRRHGESGAGRSRIVEECLDAGPQRHRADDAIVASPPLPAQLLVVELDPTRANGGEHRLLAALRSDVAMPDFERKHKFVDGELLAPCEQRA